MRIVPLRLNASARCNIAVQGCRHALSVLLCLGLVLSCGTSHGQETLLSFQDDQAREDCEPEVRDPPITDVSLSIAPRDRDGQPVLEGDLPTDCNKYKDVPVFHPILPHANSLCYARAPEGARFCHWPLFFEDACLERYGVSHGCLCQPFISGVRFFGTAVLLPAKALRCPPHRYVRTPLCY